MNTIIGIWQPRKPTTRNRTALHRTHFNYSIDDWHNQLDDSLQVI